MRRRRANRLLFWAILVLGAAVVLVILSRL